MPKRIKILFLGILGLAAFIFIGFFLPILILPESSTSVPLIRSRPTPVPPQPVSIAGSDVLRFALTYLPLSLPSTTVPQMRCFKKDRGIKGVCDRSDRVDILPAELIEIYDQLSGGKPESQEAQRIGETLLASCQRDNRVCKSSFLSFYRLYKKDQDPRFRAPLEQVGTELISGQSSTYYGQLADIQKLLILSQMTGDIEYRREAMKRYETVSAFGQNDSTNVVIYHDPELATDIRLFDCGFYGGVLQTLFETTGESKYLAESQRFFHTMPKYANRFTHLGALDMCLDGLEELASRDQNFQVSLLETLTYGLNAYWDGKETPKFTQDFGFLIANYAASVDNQILNFKLPKEHAWFLRHMVQFTEHIYELPGTNL